MYKLKQRKNKKEREREGTEMKNENHDLKNVTEL